VSANAPKSGGKMDNATVNAVHTRIQELGRASLNIKHPYPQKKIVAEFESLFNGSNVEESIKVMQSRFAEEAATLAYALQDSKTKQEELDKLREENRKRAFNF
jgi:hypothetical protein